MEFKIDRKTKAVDYAERMSEQVNKLTNPEEKKIKGQFFTSSSISAFMASLSLLNKKMKILDPGAGTGILISALVDRIISEELELSLEVDLIENDSLVIPFLEQVMNYCAELMNRHGNEFRFKIIKDDFILYNSYLFIDDLFKSTSTIDKYDLVISNPPYFKVKKNHRYSQLLDDYVFGQPNVYFMFMVVAEKLLKENGQLVFITPRSYCSGAYFERFREKFFEVIDADHIHVFSSRKGNFKGESVLQENIILSGFKRNKKNPFMIISSSATSNISDDYVHEVFPKSIIFDSTDQINLIRLPVDKSEADILELFDEWSNNLTLMNMNISTGPVVSFRNREYISQFKEGKNYPLLYMKHLNNLEVSFPISKSDEGISEKGIEKRILIPSKNYVLLKRFTSKEQKKRVDCAAYNSEKHHYQWIGLENHLNYIYKSDGDLTNVEMYGILAFLNSNLVDKYFRVVNGNTQVNASDIRPLPFPEYEKIIDLGKKIITSELEYSDVDDFLLNQQDYTQKQEGMGMSKEEQALDILSQLELSKKQQNKRSALTLLALLNLKENDDWRSASRVMLRVVDIMDFMRDHYNQHYAPNSRETIRRQTIHQFEQAQLIERNPDNPTRPTNSGNTNYAVTEEFLSLAQSYGTSQWSLKLEWFKEQFETLTQKYESKRSSTRVPVKLKEGFTLELSPGEHNILQKAIVEEFAEIFAQGAQLLYLGDTENKFLYIDKEKLKDLNLLPISHEKLPDVVLYHEDKNWLYLIEAVTSHGPISNKRKFELEKMLEHCSAGNIFVTAFPNILIFKQYANDIAWDTEIWFADNPKHMMHLNGDRFLGPR
ncbi:BsuBI/PstI family type II restriction endonuclease [Bacillus atrophaeus]|uniref:BsuBI/PstI family type II restriction endonuclease n=1 Tax=Bacillus atrophaeus TaxID=1452 RepID=UPI000B456E4E|nr:BsuBI/PstI family type II restriction endonuclease [Bacillus atrophaeus]ARW05664.1 Site-specific DNA-methyltransferase (adenine-specific) [Bacillus atrophaeus]